MIIDELCFGLLVGSDRLRFRYTEDIKHIVNDPIPQTPVDRIVGSTRQSIEVLKTNSKYILLFSISRSPNIVSWMSLATILD